MANNQGFHDGGQSILTIGRLKALAAVSKGDCNLMDTAQNLPSGQVNAKVAEV